MDQDFNDQVLKASGKTKQWILGFIFLILQFLFIAGFILGIVYNLNNLLFSSIVLWVIFFVFSLIFIGDDVEETVSFDKTKNILTIHSIRSLFKRAFCMSKENTRTFILDQIKQITVQQDCYYQHLSVKLGYKQWYKTSAIFQHDDLSLIAITVQILVSSRGDQAV